MPLPRDKKVIDEFSTYLKKHIINAGFKSQRQFALAADVNVSVISKTLSKKQRPDITSLQKFEKPLGIPLVTLMEKAGYINNSNNPNPAA